MRSVYLCYVVFMMVNDYIQTFFSEKRMSTQPRGGCLLGGEVAKRSSDPMTDRDVYRTKQSVS